jgi:phosphatidylglycerophosphatase C
MCQAPSAVAFFDFDGTLVAGDSLLPFLERLAGSSALWRGVVAASTAALGAALSGDGDYRTRFKAALLKRLLTGVTTGEAAAAASSLRSWIVWHQPTLDALRWHAQAGHRIVIATGALSVYMPTLIADLPVHDLIATDIALDAHGRFSGLMAAGNCVRAEKARRVQAYMAQRGPFAASYGYGNPPSDLPFLALMQRASVIPIVKRRRALRSPAA